MTSTSPAAPETGSRILEPWNPDGAQQQLEELGRQILYALAPDCQYPVPSEPSRQSRVPYEFDESRTSHGTSRGGFEVIERWEYYEQGAASLSRHSLVIESRKLPEGSSFVITHTGVRLSVRLQGPPAPLARVLRWFDRKFERTLDDRSLQAMALEATSALSRGAWSIAIARAQSVLEARPDHPDALLALGVASGATGEADVAEKSLRRLLDAQPGHVDALYNLANVHRSRQDLNAATDLFRRVLEIDPKNHPAAFQLAQVLEAQDGSEARQEAMKAYELAIATSPNPGGAWGYSGMDFTRLAETALARLRS